jgi:hypothetical protein
MRTTALVLTFLLSSAALADPPVDGGVPADAGTAPADAGTAPADGGVPVPPPAPLPAPTPTPTPAPQPLVSATPPSDAPAHARPTPLYRSPLFWTSLIIGAGAVAAIAAGIGLAATYHPRYALVSF